MGGGLEALPPRITVHREDDPKGKTIWQALASEISRGAGRGTRRGSHLSPLTEPLTWVVPAEMSPGCSLHDEGLVQAQRVCHKLLALGGIQTP